MSVDDQLFKQDGTLLTRVDIAILRFARVIATFLFAEEDDETFDRAMRRMVRLGATLQLAAAIFRLATGDSAAIGILIMGIINSVNRPAFGLTGVGSNIVNKLKLMNLLLLLTPFAFAVSVLTASWLKYGFLNTTAITKLVWCGGYVIWTVGFFYVSRLGNKPPKRQKVKALKLVFVEN